MLLRICAVSILLRLLWLTANRLAAGLRDLDLVRVKGREQALRIYELIDSAATPLPDEQSRLLSLFEAGLTHYREWRWDVALELFRKCLQLAQLGEHLVAGGRTQCQGFQAPLL